MTNKMKSKLSDSEVICFQLPSRHCVLCFHALPARLQDPNRLDLYPYRNPQPNRPANRLETQQMDAELLQTADDGIRSD